MGYSLQGIIHLICFNVATLVAMYSHYKTMTTDPGAVPNNAKPLVDDYIEIDHEVNKQTNTGLDKYKKMCRRCQAFKPLRAHHCSTCGRCVVKMDHHCPWVNNCVGIGNQKLFIVFLFWVNFVCCYSLILLAARVIACYFSFATDNYCTDINTVFGLVFLFMEAALFFLFTTCMMVDQLSGAMLNQTQIDRMKNEKHEVGVEINEVFGCSMDTRFEWSWLLPTPVKYSAAVKDKLYGYRLFEMKYPPGFDDDEEGDSTSSEEAEDHEETDELLAAAGPALGQFELKPASDRTHDVAVVHDIESGAPMTAAGRYDVHSTGNGNIRKRAGPP